jgi:hypothetical protein
MASAIGPAFVGGLQTFVMNDDQGYEYTITFLPDRANDDLQKEGKPAYFYWVPEQVRLARKGGRGDYKFHHTHFVGIMDESSIGMDNGETQGGVLAFTTTSQFATSVLAQAEKELIRRFTGSDEKYWGIRSNQAPRITIAPINSNITAIMNITPSASGTAPQDEAAAAAGAAAGGNGASAGEGEPAEEDGARGLKAATRGFSPLAPVPHGRGFRAPGALDPWAWKMEGQGVGSVTGGENAYAGLLGPTPSEIIWAGFHGSYSPIVVAQQLKLPVWSPLMFLRITGNWEAIYQHFSGHANASYLWFSTDIGAEVNKMRKTGAIKVELDIDNTAPGAEEMEKEINKRIDLIVQKFTEIANKVIFDPPPPKVEPAKAPSGGLLGRIFAGNAGVALKARFDQTDLDLKYEETRHFRYIMPHTISSSMEGFFDEIKQDPANEKKYFTRLVLGGLGRKITRFIKPVVNWPAPERPAAGHPVAMLSAQVGYPAEDGSIQWKPTAFQRSDPTDRTFNPAFVQWRRDEVQNPPPGWTPDKTYIKCKVHLTEPLPESDSPMIKTFVEKNVIDLNPGPNGTLTSDNILDVRADSAGMLDVGPISLGAELDASSQVVEVEFRALGRRADGTDRSTTNTRFRFTFADQMEPRFLRIFTGQLDYVPAFEYRVHVTVKGTLFNKGQAWSGPWVTGGGNGALMVSVPGPEDEGVQRRSLRGREMFSRDVVGAARVEEEEEVPEEAGVGAGEWEEVPEEEGVGVGASGGGLEQPIDEEEERPEAGLEEEPVEEEEVPAESGARSRGTPTLQGYEITTAGSTRGSTKKIKGPEARGAGGVAYQTLSDITGEKSRSKAAETSSSKRKTTSRGRAAAPTEDAGEWLPAPSNGG